MDENAIYGWFDDPVQTEPTYNPPRNAPCLFCGNSITPDNVATHSIMQAGPAYAKRSYFYRTHKSCAEVDASETAMDDIVFAMIQRNGD
jgi:hypothetical protein